MDQKTMLVRTGGDVVRRHVAHEVIETGIDGKKRLISQEPELRDDEMIVQVLSDSIPMIVKIR